MGSALGCQNPLLPISINIKNRNLPNEKRWVCQRFLQSKPTGLCQPEQREHPAGFSFFSAVGIIAINVARGADARVMNLLNSGSTALLDDLRRKIDFVVRRPNTGAKLHDQLSRVRSEMFTHLPNRI